MDIADKAADRHGRERAIRDEIVPVAVTQLGDVELECREQILRMFWRQTALGQRGAQPHRHGIVVVRADEAAIEAIEQSELLGRRKRRMIGDIVGGAHEIVERQDRLAVARMNEKGGDREILVPVALARPPVFGVVCARIVHRNSGILACSKVGLGAALPHAAAAARMLISGIEGESHIHRRDRRQQPGAHSHDTR